MSRLLLGKKSLPSMLYSFVQLHFALHDFWLEPLARPLQQIVQATYELRCTSQLAAMQYKVFLCCSFVLGPKPEDRAFVEKVLSERGGAAIPSNFQPTAPAYNPTAGRNQKGRMPTVTPRNPQTVAFLEMLGLEYNLEDAGLGFRGQGRQGAGVAAVAARVGPVVAVAVNPEEIALDDSEEDEGGDAAGDVGALAVERAAAVLAAAGVRVGGLGGGGVGAGVLQGEEDEEIIDEGPPDSDEEAGRGEEAAEDNI